jgi:hypothetical protein
MPGDEKSDPAYIVSVVCRKGGLAYPRFYGGVTTTLWCKNSAIADKSSVRYSSVVAFPRCPILKILPASSAMPPAMQIPRSNISIRRLFHYFLKLHGVLVMAWDSVK